jgi:hypothetical protein
VSFRAQRAAAAGHDITRVILEISGDEYAMALRAA